MFLSFDHVTDCEWFWRMGLEGYAEPQHQSGPAKNRENGHDPHEGCLGTLETVRDRSRGSRRWTKINGTLTIEMPAAPKGNRD